MKLEDISVSIECEIISKNDQTKFYFNKDGFVLSFLFPINENVGLLFDKISNYTITQRIKNSKLIVTDVCFKLYYIELYENDFKKAIEDFKQIICLSIDNELKEDILVKAFEKIIYFSVKSYDKACAYIKESTSMTYNMLEGTFNRRFEGSFRQYCGLDQSSK